MKKYTLVCRQDGLGETGIMFKDVMPYEDYPMVAHSGVVIAHDLVEHVNGFGNIGMLADELMALGAIWYVRGRWGDINRDFPSIYAPEEELASDVERQCRQFLDGTCLEFEVKSYRDLHDVDYVADEVMGLARKRVLREGYYDARDINHFFVQAKRLFIKGYNKAYSKYENKGHMFANNLFWNVVEEVKSLCSYECFVGQEFTLKVDGDDVKLSETEMY